MPPGRPCPPARQSRPGHPAGRPREPGGRCTWSTSRPGRVAKSWPQWVPAEVIGAFAARGIARPGRIRRVAAAHAAGGPERDHLHRAPPPASRSATCCPRSRRCWRASTVLYIAPTKALAADQLASIRSLGLPGVQAACFDGDSTRRRAGLGAQPRQVPAHHAGHAARALLPGHARWSGFFSRLRYVIIDECHGYRGVFGSHVAHVLRRLRRVVAHHAGPDGRPGRSSCSPRPRSARPGACARLLTGLDAEAVTEDGSPRGPLTFALWEPPLTAGPRRGGAPAAPDGHRAGRGPARPPWSGRERPDARLHPVPARRRGGRAGGPRALGRRSGRGAVAAYRSGLPARGPAPARGGAARRAPGRARHHHRARTRRQHHRPGRGADRGLAGDLGLAVAAGRAGRAQRADRGRGAHRARRPARHLPGPPPGDAAPPPGRGRRCLTRPTRTCWRRTCARPPPSCR